MKTIKIFVASSEELKAEREMIASLANDLSTKLEKVGIQVIAVEWENLDASMGEPHKQEEYNEKLRECEMCMVLYWTKFGMYTKTELDTAYKEKIAGNNPQKVWVYFKEIGNSTKEPSEELKEFRDSFPTKYGHFYTPFANFDTLKAHFLLQFMEYQSQALQGKSIVEVKEGKVNIDGKEYVDLQNVPFAGNNEEYNATKKSISDKRNLLQFVPSDNPLYAQTLEELDELQEKLDKMESSLWDTALMITKLSTTKCSERLQRAMDLFSKGDNKGAQAILNEEEISKDVQHNLNLIQLGEEGKIGLLTNIDEYLLKIQTYENDMEEGWIDKVISIYERCIELGRGHIDDSKNAEIISDYADFLFYQHQYSKVESVYKEALTVYRKLNQSDDVDYEPCIIYCLNQLSLYYIYSNEYQNAENVLNEILLSQKEDGEYDEQLRYAEALTRLSYLHFNQLQYKTALEECEKAISIYAKFEWHYELCESLYIKGLIHKDVGRKELAEKDVLEMLDYITKYNYEGLSISAYNLLGNVYDDQLKYDLSLEAYEKALEIIEEKSHKNPQKYLLDTAGNYHNQGRIYRLKDMYHAAYDNFIKARAILRTIVSQDPIQNSEYYIKCLYQLSDLCKEMKKYAEAEECIDEAIKYSRNLVETDAERHFLGLAHSLNIKGIILYEQKKYQEAEDCYFESLNIRRKLVADFGDQYLERVAQILSNLGLLHNEMKKIDEAEKEYLEATNIYRKIISESGLGRGGDICYTLLNLGYLNRCNKKWNKAIEYYQESIKIINKSFEEGIVREKNIAWSLISRNLVGIGYSYRALNDYEKAIGNFKEAVDIINEHINKENKIVFAPDYAIALNEYAWSLYERNECLSAEPYSEKSVDTIRLLPDNKNALRMYLDTLACIHRELGKYSEAEEEFIESLGIAEELYNQNADLNLPGLYNELKELSFLYYRVKDIDKFNQYKTKALQYYNKLSEEEKINREEDFKKLESLVIA